MGESPRSPSRRREVLSRGLVGLGLRVRWAGVRTGLRLTGDAAVPSGCFFESEPAPRRSYQAADP